MLFKHFIFMDSRCLSCYREWREVGTCGKGTDYTSIWHVFRSKNVIVGIQEIMKKSYISLLQTLFLTRSVPTLTSLPVTSTTLTMKTSTKMKFSCDKIYYNFLRRIQRLQEYKIPADIIYTLNLNWCLPTSTCHHFRLKNFHFWVFVLLWPSKWFVDKTGFMHGMRKNQWRVYTRGDHDIWRMQYANMRHL